MAEKEIPLDVKNIDAYNEWLKLQKEVETSKERFFKASDGLEYDLSIPLVNLRRKVNHLPEVEKEVLFKKNKPFLKIRGQMMVLKQKFQSDDGNSYTRPTVVLESRKEELIELFGQWRTVSEVHEIMVNKWEIHNIEQRHLKAFFSTYKDQIVKLRTVYESDYSDVSLSQKRCRLNILDSLLQDRRRIYNETHKIEDSREVRGIVEQARKEVEGDNLKIDVRGRIDIEAHINIEMQDRVLSSLTLNQMIVSKVAARLNINPTLIMYSLTNSMYSKFTGFQRNDKMQSTKPVFPSQMVYEWDIITENHEIQKEEFNKKKQLPDIQEAEIVEVKQFKDKIQEAINKRKKMIAEKEKLIYPK